MLIAAYVFVLNTLLATALLSSVPAQAFDSTEICATAYDPATPQQGGTNNDAQRTAAHCTLHCSAFAGTALSPQAPFAFDRVVITTAQRFVGETGRIDPERVAQYRPRGPPRLA
jgi:hypothetical protein